MRNFVLPLLSENKKSEYRGILTSKNMLGAQSYKYSGGSNAAERLDQVQILARNSKYTQCQFIRNGVNSRLEPFLIFLCIMTSLRFLVLEFYMVMVS